MAKWRIDYKGFAFIEADTAEEAKEMFENGESYYEEQEDDYPVEVNEFVIEM